MGRLLQATLDHFAVRRSSYRCPGPSLGSTLPRCLSAGLLSCPKPVPLLPFRAWGPAVQRRAAGVARRSGCTLSGRSQAARDLSGARREAVSGTLDPLGGPGIPWTCFLVLSSASETDEFYLRIAYFWKCELASLSIHTHQIFACLQRVEPGMRASASLMRQVCCCSYSLDLLSLLQNRNGSPSSPTTCSPVSYITMESPSPLYL